tara:strand:+ start:4053 stop:4475 length:423 start_codon:yes stop_codon:yes gene_type:complete
MIFYIKLMLTLSQINNILNSDVTVNTSHKIFQKFTNRCFIHTFITEFYKCNEMFERSSVVVALIYLNRYTKVKSINYTNIKQLLETCLILANKYCLDFEITDSGPLESHVLNSIEWNLYVKDSEYEYFKNLINSYINLND